MDDNRQPTREELEQALEKAKRDWQEMLKKMTPEQRLEAERKAQQAVAGDEAERQRMLEECAKVMAQTQEKPKPQFCGNCGAPAGNGSFCSYCGKPLIV